MSGGGTGNAVQGYPQVANNAMTQAYGAGAQPSAQNISQLQQLLRQMGTRPQGGGQSPAMQAMGMGQQLMRAGQQPMPQMAPQMRPVGAPMPMQAPMIPQMGMQTQALNPSAMNMLLARQNGLMG